jgi:hypothetical protein
MWTWDGVGCVPAFTFPLPLFALVALARGLVTVAGAGAARGGNLSLEISVTEAGEDGCAISGVRVVSCDSMGAGDGSLPSKHVGGLGWRRQGAGVMEVVVVHITVL